MFTDEDGRRLLGLRGVPSRLYREVTRIGYYGHFEVLVTPFCVFTYAEKRVGDLGHVIVLDFVESLLERDDIWSRIQKRLRKRFRDGDIGIADYFRPFLTEVA